MLLRLNEHDTQITESIIMNYNTLVRVIAVDRQWVVAVQYGAILGHDGPFPVCIKKHTIQIITY